MFLTVSWVPVCRLYNMKPQVIHCIPGSVQLVNAAVMTSAFSIFWLYCAAGTSRSHWISFWGSSQRLSSCPASLVTWFCWSSISGQHMMHTPPRMHPACSFTSSTCVSSTTTTPPASPSTGDRCSPLINPSDSHSCPLFPHALLEHMHYYSYTNQIKYSHRYEDIKIIISFFQLQFIKCNIILHIGELY